MKTAGRRNAPRPSFGAAKGFTLLEVLVAMAILATVLVVLLESHSMSIKMSERSRMTSIAANLARDLLTEVEIEGFPDVGSETGDFNTTYPGVYNGFTWEREVSESIFVDFIREVVVRVHYFDNGVKQTVELLDLIGAKDTQDQEEAGVSTGLGQLSSGESALLSSMGRTSSGSEDKE